MHSHYKIPEFEKWKNILGISIVSSLIAALIFLPFIEFLPIKEFSFLYIPGFLVTAIPNSFYLAKMYDALVHEANKLTFRDILKRGCSHGFIVYFLSGTITSCALGAWGLCFGWLVVLLCTPLFLPAFTITGTFSIAALIWRIKQANRGNML